MLPAAEIERIFRRHDAMFGDTYNSVYNTAVVLWAFLSQVLADGFTATMPDTPENQKEFPQQKSHKPGIGFPIMRVCVILSLATACVMDAAFGPCSGKETGETALLREIRFQVTENGRRTETLTVVTTLPRQARHGHHGDERRRQHGQRAGSDRDDRVDPVRTVWRP